MRRSGATATVPKSRSTAIRAPASTRCNILDNTLHGNDGPTSLIETASKAIRTDYDPQREPDQLHGRGQHRLRYRRQAGSGNSGNGLAPTASTERWWRTTWHTTSAPTPRAAAARWESGHTTQMTSPSSTTKLTAWSLVPYTTGCDWDGFDLDGDTNQLDDAVQLLARQLGSGVPALHSRQLQQHGQEQHCREQRDHNRGSRRTAV